MIYRLPKYLYVVVCANGTACTCPDHMGSSWEDLPRQPYTSRKEAQAIARDLDGVANYDAASLDPPFRAPCGPHRIVRYTKDAGKRIRTGIDPWALLPRGRQ